jgi:hypothetical protein
MEVRMVTKLCIVLPFVAEEAEEGAKSTRAGRGQLPPGAYSATTGNS